jgi:serine/threonine-protein kinase
VVALKRIHPELEAEHEFVASYRTLATACTALSHPNVVKVLDVGEEAARDGGSAPRHHVVMQYVAGAPLNAVLNRLLQSTRQIPRGLGLLVVRSVLQALEHARGAGPGGGAVVHGDVAPCNVLLGLDGVVRLGDFGLTMARARLTHPRNAGLRFKLHYMSPEQARGLTVDHRADIYGAGILLYELLLQRRMRRGATDAEVQAQVSAGTWQTPEGLGVALDPALAGLLARALEVEPGRRHASAGAFLGDLDAALAGKDPVMTQPELAETMARLFPELPAREEEARARITDSFAKLLGTGPRALPAEEAKPAAQEAPVSGEGTQAPWVSSAPPPRVSMKLPKLPPVPKLPRVPRELSAGARATLRKVMMGVLGAAVLVGLVVGGVKVMTGRGRTEVQGGTLTRDLGSLVGGRTTLFWAERLQALDRRVADLEAQGVGALDPRVVDLKARREDTVRKARALGLTEIPSLAPVAPD